MSGHWDAKCQKIARAAGRTEQEAMDCTYEHNRKCPGCPYQPEERGVLS